MAITDDAASVAERLGQFLDRGLLAAGGPAEAAERLVERLQRPARVALLGLPGSGKSAVLNLLAGAAVVPDTLRLPTIILQHGPEARMICTLADGRHATVPGSDLEKALTLKPAMITVERDLPALKVISLLEVSAGAAETEQRRASQWAGKRSDILIWCTTAYLPKEQLIWEGMPDTFKDNGFLLITKIDLLGGREAAAGMHHRIAQRAAPEFRQILSISTKEARAATPDKGAVDRVRFRDSGASALIATIKSRVQMALQADMDTAEVILARHSESAVPPPQPKYELRSVAGKDMESLSNDDLAAEAEALKRVAAAAAELIAAPKSREAEIGPPDALDLFPEPDRDDLEPDPTERPSAREATLYLHPADASETDPDAALLSAIGAAISAGGSARPVANPAPEGRPEAADGATDSESAAEASDSSARFAARLKEVSSTVEPPPTGLVPLRATWKSRSDGTTEMPIEPRPEPNRNPTPRQRPIDPAHGATLVGRPLRRPDQPAVSDAAAEAAPTNPPTSAAPADQPPPKVSTEPETRSAKPASVFGARQKPEGPKSLGLEPSPLEPAPPQVPEAAPPNPEATPGVVGGTSVHVLRNAVSRPPAPDAAEPPPTPEAAAERRERPRFAPRPSPSAPVATPVPVSERALLDQAIELVVARAVDLSDQIDPEEKLPVDLILEHCGETTDQALAILGHGVSEPLRRIRGGLGDIQDLVVLMQLEKGRAPADDVLTLLLQLRREMETLRAT